MVKSNNILQSSAQHGYHQILMIMIIFRSQHLTEHLSYRNRKKKMMKLWLIMKQNLKNMTPFRISIKYRTSIKTAMFNLIYSREKLLNCFIIYRSLWLNLNSRLLQVILSRRWKMRMYCTVFFSPFVKSVSQRVEHFLLWTLGTNSIFRYIRLKLQIKSLAKEFVWPVFDANDRW